MRRLTAVIALAGLFAHSPAFVSAGSVDISIPTTQAQDAKLARLLETVNAERVDRGLEPYADFNAYAKDVLIEAVKSYIKAAEAADKSEVAEAYAAANATLQAQIRQALGLE